MEAQDALPLTSFYDPPSPLGGRIPGALIRSEPFDGYSLPAGAHAVRILYVSRALDGALCGLVDAHPEAEDQILAELELSAVAARRLVIVAEPALDELLSGGGNDTLDAVPGHEIQTARLLGSRTYLFNTVQGRVSA